MRCPKGNGVTVETSGFELDTSARSRLGLPRHDRTDSHPASRAAIPSFSLWTLDRLPAVQRESQRTRSELLSAPVCGGRNHCVARGPRRSGRSIHHIDGTALEEGGDFGGGRLHEAAAGLGGCPGNVRRRRGQTVEKSVRGAGPYKRPAWSLTNRREREWGQGRSAVGVQRAECGPASTSLRRGKLRNVPTGRDIPHSKSRPGLFLKNSENYPPLSLYRFFKTLLNRKPAAWAGEVGSSLGRPALLSLRP